MSGWLLMCTEMDEVEGLGVVRGRAGEGEDWGGWKRIVTMERSKEESRRRKGRKKRMEGEGLGRRLARMLFPP